jgi:hypothetical protein
MKATGEGVQPLPWRVSPSGQNCTSWFGRAQAEGSDVTSFEQGQML